MPISSRRMAVGGAPYGYLFMHPFSTPEITSATAVPTSGHGLVIPLVDSVNAGGPLRAGIPFLVDWEGVFTIEFADKENARFTLHTKHVTNGKTFNHRRAYDYEIRASTRRSIGLNIWNSHTMLRPGSYTDSDGTTVNLTEEDFAADTVISYDLEITAFNNAMTQRQAATVDYFNIENGCQLAYQLQ